MPSARHPASGRTLFRCQTPRCRTDELVAAIGMVGDDKTLDARLQEYRDAGADAVCLVPANPGDDGGLRILSAMSQILA